jgi:hypothetical protein
LVALVALAVFGAASVLTWQAFTPGSGPGRVWQPGYPSPPASGYYFLFPDQGGVSWSTEHQFSVSVTVLTNLPDGTLLDVSGGDLGAYAAVKDGRTLVTALNGSCDGPVDALNSPGFKVEVTARPVPLQPIGLGGRTAKQPQSVLDVLGQHFENLTGDEVVEQKDGSRWLVGRTRYKWPTPQCGGKLALFGGPTCDPSQSRFILRRHFSIHPGRLTGPLKEVMIDVMGAISQGRMCEFWSVMLPPDVEQQHPWPAFADEWRPWLLRQNFADEQPSASHRNWTTGPLHWVAKKNTSGSKGTTVEVIHDGKRIATLQLQRGPFWGVTNWTLY